MLNPLTLIETLGYVGLCGIVFAETGLFVGFFLPGDSLLFTAGFLASQGVLNIVVLMPLLLVAAISGNSVGYTFGRKIGPRIFTKKESRFFKPDHVKRAHEFFVRHGKKAVILAQFMPIMRTFVPIISGVAEMPYKNFVAANVIGAFSWVWGVLLLGYFLGKSIPDADRFLYPIILLIILVSFLPVLNEYRKSRRV